MKRPVPEIRVDGFTDGLVVLLQNFFDGVEKIQPYFQRNDRLIHAGPGLAIETIHQHITRPLCMVLS
jgi:hypothetical protein